MFCCSSKPNLACCCRAVDGKGVVTTNQPNGKPVVTPTSTDNGSAIRVLNKVGEDIAQMYADEYGNGVVGAYNRKGRGTILSLLPPLARLFHLHSRDPSGAVVPYHLHSRVTPHISVSMRSGPRGLSDSPRPAP